MPSVARRERDRHDRFQAARRFRDPRVLDRAAAIEADEAAVVRPRSALVLDRVVEEAVDDGIDDDALDAEPEPARALRIEPHVEHLLGRAVDRAGNGEIERLHLSLSFLRKERLEAIEALVPEPFVARRPPHDLAERPRVERERVLASPARAAHQPGALEDPDVLGDGRPATSRTARPRR